MKDKIAIGAAVFAFAGMHFVPTAAQPAEPNRENEAAPTQVLPPVNIKPPRIKSCPGTKNKRGKLTHCHVLKPGEVLKYEG